jgi:hypothetical protein
MGMMEMVVVLLAQAAPLPAGAPNDTERSIVVPDTTLPVTVDVNSNLGKRFKLIDARVVMDGRELAHRTADPGQELEHQFRAYDGEVGPGPHQVTVALVYEGRNVGLFTYMDDYKIRVQSSADFTAQDRAHPAAVQVLAYERSGFTIPVEKRPTMEIKTASAAAGPAVGATAPGTR